MKIYQTKVNKLSGTQYAEVSRQAREIYNQIKRKTKRRPYIRSAYFNKEKIFLEFYWQHLYEKSNHRDKIRRIKYFPCAIELIENSRFEPISKKNPNRSSEILHRLIGSTPSGEQFIVQIKEENSGQKWLVSIFPKV